MCLGVLDVIFEGRGETYSESVPPYTRLYAAGDSSFTTSRLMAWKSLAEPLCMKVCRPNTKGWLLILAMAVPDEARICANKTFVSELAHIDKKLLSFRGGWIVL